MNIRSHGQYYGNKKHEQTIMGIQLSEYQYNDELTPWHYHEHPYFMYVLEGDMTDINHSKKAQLTSGNLIFHNWQEPHFNERKSDTARGFHIQLDRSWFEDKKLDIDLWEGSQILEDPILHHLLSKIYYEFRINDLYSSVSLELLILQLCELIHTNNLDITKKEPSWVKPLKEILSINYSALTLSYLSEQLGVHPVHLSRSIPKYFGCNLGEYLRRQRIKQAFSLLLNPSYNLTHIAYECGFSDQSHFTKTFKNYYRLTPSAFRKGLQ